MTLSLLSISHEPVSLPVTPVQARADILHWHLLPKHGNLPLTKGARIYESKCTNKARISQIKTVAGWSGGKVSPLIYVLVETCWISPIHFSAMPLLWQPVCKYLLTLTRTKQCHCTSRWFSLHVWAEYACVRHWSIHTAVVCIPGNSLFMHVRVYVQMSLVDVDVLLVDFTYGVRWVRWAQTQLSSPCLVFCVVFKKGAPLKCKTESNDLYWSLLTQRSKSSKRIHPFEILKSFSRFQSSWISLFNFNSMNTAKMLTCLFVLIVLTFDYCANDVRRLFILYRYNSQTSSCSGPSPTWPRGPITAWEQFSHQVDSSSFKTHVGIQNHDELKNDYSPVWGFRKLKIAYVEGTILERGIFIHMHTQNEATHSYLFCLAWNSNDHWNHSIYCMHLLWSL